MTKTTAKKEKIGIPPLLAFSRKLEPSEALMHSGLWKDDNIENQVWTPIKIYDKRNRATKSHFKASEKEKENQIYHGVIMPCCHTMLIPYV